MNNEVAQHTGMPTIGKADSWTRIVPRPMNAGDCVGDNVINRAFERAASQILERMKGKFDSRMWHIEFEVKGDGHIWQNVEGLHQFPQQSPLQFKVLLMKDSQVMDEAGFTLDGDSTTLNEEV